MTQTETEAGIREKQLHQQLSSSLDEEADHEREERERVSRKARAAGERVCASQ